ncbi:MAG TPA: winged helix-turn-helix domain-containing protein [Thermoanaerobaculia bacterium]|jgi:DNA-binding winged helix-turn-helix (wHTH) protein/tetratricopeptide (TPR) repeat protein|nr:winged helix-turn-helix domain-containing protein [Thermoanaerobaculia bacterium]
MPAESEAYAFGPYVLDRSRRALLRDGDAIGVTPKAFDLLTILAENGGSVVSKETLMTRLWPDTVVEEGSLAFQISTLRKALGEGRYIVTVPGRGYQLAGPVQTAETAAVEAIVRDEERTTITVSDDRKPIAFVAVVIVAVIAIVVAAWLILRNRPAAGTSIHSIAVLPFKPIAGGHRDEALELGMADTLITRLSHLANVTVSPTSAVRRFNKLDQDPLAAARDLGVDSVLEGSLQRGTDRIRVTVRLLRTADGRSLWAEQYDEKALDLFAVEDKVADGVARSIVPALSGREQQFLAKRTTAYPAAYDLYLKGVYWKGRDSIRAEEFFNRAIALDPKFAAAWAGVASSSLLRGRFASRPAPDTFEHARQAAQRAIALDPDLADAHAAIAAIHADYDWQFDRADAEFRRALELDPNSLDAHIGYAYLLVIRREFDAATEHARRAQELDPLSATAAVTVGLALDMAGKTDEAIRSLRETLRLYPDLIPAKLHLGLALSRTGHADEGAAVLRDAIRLRPQSTALNALLASALVRGGHRDEAMQIVRDLEKRSATEQVDATAMGEAWTALGNFDRAFSWLNQACDQRVPLVRTINSEPGYAPLRNDPRFAALLKRIGL